jgi:branched-chain amino acid aminotransferase
MSRREMVDATNETIRANNVKDGYIRLVATRGVGALGLTPDRTACPSVIIIADQIELYPREYYEKGMALVSSTFVRNHPNALPARIKSCNYLNNILAKIEAKDAGCLEAVMYNHVGNVAECTADNIFLVRAGIVQTPPITAGILEGITRDTVIELLAKRDIPFKEMELSRHDLYVSDECFLTGSATEVIPVTFIDGRPVGDGKPGRITRQLIADFQAFVQQEA